MSLYLLDEMSTPALDALDRARTVVILPVSPLETHGPHLPVGVDAIAARHIAQRVGERLVAARPGWSVVLAPTLHLGSFTFDSVGTVGVRQRVVRDVVLDYGDALARSGFRYVLVANGHGGPGHLTALEEAAGAVSRRHGIVMASFTGRLAWEFLRGRYLDRIEAELGRTLSAEERRAFAEDAHGGWWETSLMLMLRPDLVDDGYRTLPPARYSWPERLVPNYPLRGGGRGYVGHPALADPAFAKAASEVLLAETMELVDGLLDGRVAPAAPRSPFFAIPFFRTGFWPAAAAAMALVAVGALALLARRSDR
ncbi:MAG TPA: creatininase family protein [Methylomirabilota bacterium]|nr:creatininase family protein [Methylomirabilota bacterium]